MEGISLVHDRSFAMHPIRGNGTAPMMGVPSLELGWSTHRFKHILGRPLRHEAGAPFCIWGKYNVHMRTSRCSHQDAAAFFVAAALERYQAALTRLLTCERRVPCLHEVIEAFEALRMECAALPVVSVAWAAALISHFELLSGICGYKGPEDASTQERLRDHQLHIDALSRECRLLMRGRHVHQADGSAA